jgi:hypothetical protein
MNLEIVDLIQIGASLATIVTLFLVIRQVDLARNANSFNALKSVYDENLQIRKLYDEGVIQANKFLLEIADLEENINIKSIYGQEKYNELREIGYHFEFIGTLVRRKIIPFKVIFDIISFPDDLWLKTNEFRTVMKRSYFRDFWENFGYLNSEFQKERKKTVTNKI